MTPDDRALLRLLACGGASAPRRRLLDRHATPEAALAAGEPRWREAGLDAAQARALAAGTGVAPETGDWLARPGHRLIGWHDPDYPPLLRQAPSPPLAHELADALRGRLGPAPAAAGNAASGLRNDDAPADPDYQTLWRALGHDPSPMDRLVERTGLTVAELSSMLLVMELDGRVVTEHGRYSRKT